MRLSKARKACVTAMMKDTIFDAASSVIEEKGTDGLTMDRVATKVGMATASLYSYFRDKNDLLQFFYSAIGGAVFSSDGRGCQAELPAPQKLAGRFSTRPWTTPPRTRDSSESWSRWSTTPRYERLPVRGLCMSLRQSSSKESRRGPFARTKRRIRVGCFSGVSRNCCTCRPAMRRRGRSTGSLGT